MDDIQYGFAVETRYHGATNYKGSRISARLTDGKDRRFKTVFVPYPHELSGRDCHLLAARELLAQWDAVRAVRAGGAFRPLQIIASAGSERGYVFMAA